MGGYILYPHYIAITLSVRPFVRPSVSSHFRNRYISFYWKKWFYIWYMALAWWLVPCLPFPGLPHVYFLFTVRLRIFHVCRNENFRNSYLSFYWKKWFYIWYMSLAWWLVPCLPFPGLPHIYFLFTVRLTNEWVGIFLARRSVQHLVSIVFLIQWTWRTLKELDFQPIWTRFIGHNCGRRSSKDHHKMTEAKEWQNITWAFNYLWGVKIVNGSKYNYMVGLWSKLYLFIQIWY